MAYERMTLASFSESLKAGKYDTATGARRAVGKGDFGPHDKKLAHDAINAHFGEGGEKPAATRGAKKTAKKLAPKKLAAKKSARVAKKTSSAAKAAAAPVAKRPYTRRAPAAAAQARAVDTKDSSATAKEPLYLPVAAVSPSLLGEAVVRERNAAEIVVAYANNAARTPAEERLYQAAMSKATSAIEAPSAPAPKPQPVSLRDQLAASAPSQPLASVLDPAAVELAAKTARALTGPSYGTGTIDTNSVGTPHA